MRAIMIFWMGDRVLRAFTIAILLASICLLQACSDNESVIEQTKPLVVQLTKVKQSNLNKTYEFPATVSAVRDVDLKFEVSGRLIFEDLVEGREVSKGQVLARIDPAPFERKVAESKTRHEDAIRALSRIKEMSQKNLASQRELDDATSNFTLSKIALENAKQDLSYSTIKAPFDGVVGARLIENNSYIRTGDAIASLQDRSKLHFYFEVPERIMTANVGNQNIKATAFIIGQEQNVFDLQYVEHKTTPDPVTQTYGATFAIDGKATELFYPGSRAMVKIEDLEHAQSLMVIPLNALVGDKASGFFVWRFNAQSDTVEKASVEVTTIVGEHVVISGGLSEQDKVVSAAVNQMRAGLAVKEYKAEF